MKPCRGHGVVQSSENDRSTFCRSKENEAFFFLLLIEVSLVWVSQVVLVVKNTTTNAGDIRDVDLTPGSRRSPGEENGNLLQYSCLENPMDKRLWQVQSVELQRAGYD